MYALNSQAVVFRYPFTACEVFCCEVEAIFNTLLSQPQLMQLLFSLLDSPPPLSCKAAGYFGRVVQHLLLRKTNETMAYLQENKEVLESLINHIDTTSIADIFKRLLGADEQTSAALLPNHLLWLAETQLIELLLQRFGPEYSAEVQQNAADILTSVAHTQPSPIALKLTKDQSITYLFQHALAPGGRVLVSALDVCIALLEPRRHSPLVPMQGDPGYDTGILPSKKDAVQATLKYLGPLVDLLDAADPEATQETPFGMLRPPLGTARLKIVELLAVLLRAGEDLAERAVIDAGAVPKCLDLFVAYPFNNLLHYHVTAMVVTGVTSKNNSIIEYLFGTCKVAEWLVAVPPETRPLPRPGTEASAALRPPLRAGYMGHISYLAQVRMQRIK
jgi:serine/threonine-protein phosphatase 6 regulatory subunit 3